MLNRAEAETKIYEKLKEIQAIALQYENFSNGPLVLSVTKGSVSAFQWENMIDDNLTIHINEYKGAKI